MDKEQVIFYFLKAGLSTRKIDTRLGMDSSKSKGWNSWKILQEYSLKNADKGMLFLYSTRQVKKIIKIYMQEQEKGNKAETISSSAAKEPNPNVIEKYKDAYMLAKNEEQFYQILSGETRNIIQTFFSPLKQFVGKCQFENCNETQLKNLHTAHYGKDRPQIFKESVINSVVSSNEQNINLKQYDIYETMKKFLESHMKDKSVCFLCKKHHDEFHKTEKESKEKLIEFKKKIIFD